MTAQKRRRGWRDALTDGGVAGAWLLVAWAQAQGGQPLDWGLAAQSGLIAWLFLTRGAASRSASMLDQALATGTTILPMLMLQQTNDGLPMLGTAIEIAALAWLLWSLAALGTSIGVAPAVRSIVVYGPYRWMRHPLYAGSIAYVAGYLISHPNAGNAAVLVLLTIGQVIRAQREEALLAQCAEYRAYMSAVRGRFLPSLTQFMHVGEAA